MITLHSPAGFETLEKKELFLSFISNVLEGQRFEFFSPNNNEENFILDSGNNWRADFDQESPKRVKIAYRYNGEHNSAERKLCDYLCWRLNLTIVELEQE